MTFYYIVSYEPPNLPEFDIGAFRTEQNAKDYIEAMGFGDYFAIRRIAVLDTEQ